MNNEIKEIKINKANKSITFINNGIAFSQFGIADEILDLITSLQEQLHQASLDIQELTEKDIGCPSWCDKLINLQQTLDETVDNYTEEYNLRKELDLKLTNLQQENERLKEQLEYLRSGEYLNQVKWERDLNENLNQTLGIELEDYKSRCEKALKTLLFNLDTQDTIFKAINILQNGSENK